MQKQTYLCLATERDINACVLSALLCVQVCMDTTTKHPTCNSLHQQNPK